MLFRSVINNTSGFATDFTMGGTATFNLGLTMTQGVVQTTGGSFIAMAAGSTNNIGSATTFIDGPMTIDLASTTPTALTFPIGKSGSYRPMVLNVTHSTAANVTYTNEHFQSSAAALGYTLPGTIDRVSGLRYWTVTRSAVANLTSATATLYYGIGTGDGVLDPPNLRVVKTIGAGVAWVDVGGTGSAAGAGNITSVPFTTIGTFTLGNNTGGANPLPIELTSFNATARDNQVDVTWTTASELNNDFFELQRSSDGKNFVALTQIQGQGTTAAESSYQYLDEKPVSGRSYYRLKQVDLDQTITYSKIVAVELTSTNQRKVSVYPNPVSGDTFTVRLGGFGSDGNVVVRVFDMMGKNLILGEFSLSTNDAREVNISRSGLSPGVYLISIIGKNGQTTSRLVIR